MDFFKKACQSGPYTALKFGVCDKQDSAIAYVDLQNPDEWTARVRNDQAIPVVFTAIDKCVILDDEHPERGRCDGMLTTEKLLYLIELKDMRSGWRQLAIDQLESTIIFLLQHHDVKEFRHKKAFACNKRRPAFAEVDNEQQLLFFRKYGFRLDLQADVVILS